MENLRAVKNWASKNVTPLSSLTVSDVAFEKFASVVGVFNSNSGPSTQNYVDASSD